MGDDSPKPGTSDSADSLKAAGTSLEPRMNPADGAGNRQLKRASDAFKAELWRMYLQSRDSPVTKSACWRAVNQAGRSRKSAIGFQLVGPTPGAAEELPAARLPA